MENVTVGWTRCERKTNIFLDHGPSIVLLTERNVSASFSPATAADDSSARAVLAMLSTCNTWYMLYLYMCRYTRSQHVEVSIFPGQSILRWDPAPVFLNLYLLNGSIECYFLGKICDVLR